MIADNSPCRSCTDRHMLCHNTCAKYKAWRVDLTAETAEEKAKRAAQYAIDEYCIASARRNYKRKYPSRKPGKKGV